MGRVASHDLGILVMVMTIATKMMMMVMMVMIAMVMGTYLIFVIFFTLAKFLENKIYTEKRQFFALNL